MGEGKWSAVEHRTLLDAVKPGEPFRQLGVYANMRGDCRKQLDHIINGSIQGQPTWLPEGAPNSRMFS